MIPLEFGEVIVDLVLQEPDTLGANVCHHQVQRSTWVRQGLRRWFAHFPDQEAPPLSPMPGDLPSLLRYRPGHPTFVIDKDYVVGKVKIDKPLKHEHHQTDLVIVTFLGYLSERLQREDLCVNVLKSSLSSRPFGLDDSDVLQNHRK